MDPTHETPSDEAGERVRDTTPPQRPGATTPAPPLRGPDVNDVDSLEGGVGPFLGGPSTTTLPKP
jgi:hypothetical protein